MSEYMNQINVLLPEVFLAIAACGVLMIGVFSKCFKYGNVLLALTFSVAIYFLLVKVPGYEIVVFDGLFKTTGLIRFLKLLVLISGLFYAILGSKKQSEGCSVTRTDLFEFPVLLMLAVTGMLLMLSANNFLSFYVSLELQSFCLYVLASFEREDSKSSEAGLKYFVLGSFASGLLLFGVSLIYGFTGNLDFDALSILLSGNTSGSIAIGVIIGIIMFLIGIFFKISAAPFHMWTPDVYQGAPTIVTSFFATVAKVATVGVLLRIVTDVLPGWKMDLQPIFILITCISVLVGSIGALRQTNIKRLLAYSSIGHVGYMLLAISAFVQDLSVVIYLGIYVTMTLGVFAMIMNIKSNNKDLVEIKDLSGLSKENPLAAAALAVFMFSLAGIPPFAGFFAKFYVFQTALTEGLYVTVLVAVISAVISAYYYLRIVKIMYLDEAHNKFTNEMTYGVRITILTLVLFNLFYILFSY
jgi:NADH-quinone oxidoreductase subunit N